jgi:hypothetical protein
MFGSVLTIPLFFLLFSLLTHFVFCIDCANILHWFIHLLVQELSFQQQVVKMWMLGPWDEGDHLCVSY